jgi:hypothetical protein
MRDTPVSPAQCGTRAVTRGIAPLVPGEAKTRRTQLSKGISPAVTVIVIVLVIIIAGLLWYIYSTPRATPGAKTNELFRPITKETIKSPAEVKEKAAAAKRMIEGEQKASEGAAKREMKAEEKKVGAEQTP